jgi:hypothetical protein
MRSPRAFSSTCAPQGPLVTIPRPALAPDLLSLALLFALALLRLPLTTLSVMGWSPFGYVLGETLVQNHRIRVRVRCLSKVWAPPCQKATSHYAKLGHLSKHLSSSIMQSLILSPILKALLKILLFRLS